MRDVGWGMRKRDDSRHPLHGKIAQRAVGYGTIGLAARRIAHVWRRLGRPMAR